MELKTLKDLEKDNQTETGDMNLLGYLRCCTELREEIIKWIKSNFDKLWDKYWDEKLEPFLKKNEETRDQAYLSITLGVGTVANEFTQFCFKEFFNIKEEDLK